MLAEVSVNAKVKTKVCPTRLRSLEANVILNELSAFFVRVAKLAVGVEVKVPWVVAELPVQAGIVRSVVSPRK